jgi:hypothetical protein
MNAKLILVIMGHAIINPVLTAAVVIQGTRGDTAKMI